MSIFWKEVFIGLMEGPLPILLTIAVACWIDERKGTQAAKGKK